MLFDFNVLVCVFVLCAKSSATSQSQMWQDNMKRISQFKCGEPQVRAIRAEKLLEMAHFEIAFPYVAVLKRCGDETGCCDSHTFCASKKSADISLCFKIYNIVNGKQRFLTYHGQNDVECACRKHENSIK